MRKVPVFLLAVCLTALLAGGAGQAVPLRGAAQLGALSAAAVTSEAVADEKQDVPALADAPDVENPLPTPRRMPSRRRTPSSPKASQMLLKAPCPMVRDNPTYRSSRLRPNSR